ncbi:hypothetical protein TKK_0001033 [Trichogramma kaykai]|uniref:Large ribosomal subunit protein mL64 n=1 Tax=Trichogramma kaykai TaxID=54128 RepID=A0ABD2WRR0_9HYME
MNPFVTRSTSNVFSFRTLKKIVSKYCYSTTSKVTEVPNELEVEEIPQYEVEIKFTEEEIEKMRNVSGLAPQHRNIIHDKKPYNNAPETYHNSIWYKKKLIGRYGLEAAEVNPAICWPTKDDILDLQEYEKIEYPDKLQELWKKFENDKIEAKEKIRKREEEIDKTVANFDKWQADLESKIQAKEAALLLSKQQRQRTLDEVREQYGYRIDPNDEKFKELLEKKEKEDKKKKKLLKKQLAKEKVLKFLQKKEEESKMSKETGSNSNDKKEDTLK